MIGDRIRIRRQELGLTQEELAKRMGYKSKSTINKVESGKNDVNQSTTLKYAKALETSVAYLMGWNSIEEEAIASSPLLKVAHDNIKDKPIYDALMEKEIKELLFQKLNGKISEDEKDIVLHFRNANITSEQKAALKKIICANIDTYIQFLEETNK